MATAKNKSLHFEDALSELETLIAQMEQGRMPLEDSLNAYKKGTELIKFCQGKLQEVEQALLVLDNGELKSLDLQNGSE